MLGNKEARIALENTCGYKRRRMAIRRHSWKTHKAIYVYTWCLNTSARAFCALRRYFDERASHGSDKTFLMEDTEANESNEHLYVTIFH